MEIAAQTGKTPWIPIISAAVTYALVYFGIEYLETADAASLMGITFPKEHLPWLSRLRYLIKYALVFGLFSYCFGHRRAAISAFSVVVVLQFITAFTSQGTLDFVIRQIGYWLPFITYVFLAFGRKGLLLGAAMVCFQATHLTSLPEMAALGPAWRTLIALLGLELKPGLQTILTSLFYPASTDPFGLLQLSSVTGLAIMYFWLMTAVHRLSPQLDKDWSMFRWIDIRSEPTKTGANTQFFAQRWYLYALCLGAFRHLAFIGILSSGQLELPDNYLFMFASAAHRQLLCWGGLLLVAWWHRKFLLEYWSSRGQTPSFGYWLLQLPFVGLFIWIGQQFYFGTIVPLQERIARFQRRDDEVVQWLKVAFLGVYAIGIIWQFVGQRTDIVDTNFFVLVVGQIIVTGLMLGLYINRPQTIYWFVPLVAILTSINIVLLSAAPTASVYDKRIWLAGLGPCLLVVYYALFHLPTFYHTVVVELE